MIPQNPVPPDPQDGVQQPSSSSARAAPSRGDELGAVELSRRVADSLHRLRTERRMSLDQLATASGVSRAALSQIEGARTNPTLSVLWKIAVGLAVPFQSLLGQDTERKCHILRASDSNSLRSMDGRVESRLLSPAGASLGSEVYELRFQPRGVQQSEAHARGTSETVLVLAGRLRIAVEEETHDLTAGDTIHFRADVAHTYTNQGPREARCIDMITYGRPVT